MGNLRDNLAAERERWILWLPVLFGTGVGVYFGLPLEPPWWTGGALTFASVVALWRLVRRHGAEAGVIAAVAVATAAAGFAAAQWRTATVAAPMVGERLGPTGVVGRVVAVGRLAKGARVTLERLRVSGLDPARTPDRIRLRLAGNQPAMKPGDWLRLRAVVTPPPPPSAPGAFDFQRQSFFRRIGGVGFAFGPATVIASPEARGLEAVPLVVARLRHAVTERILRALPGTEGGASPRH